MPPRRAGAPRLIEWTGERLVPWARDAQTVYEHFHRYLWAQPLVAGRRVLDLGSGEGFGSALLADRAASVTGVDIDALTVEHSRANYAGASLVFTVASATDLSAFADSSFDAVVAFEMIEHVTDQERVLAEIARVLAPDGLVIMSTPERRAYSEDRGFVNPFHERELTRDEFVALLGSRFSEVALFSQRPVTGSRIEALSGPAAAGHLSLPIERAGDDWQQAAPPPPFYLVAVASEAALPEIVGESTLFDYGTEVLAERRATIESLLQQMRDQREQHVAEVAAKQELLTAEQARAQRAEDELAEHRASVTWQFLERVRSVFYGVIPPDSRLGRGVSALLRKLGGR
jgi:SAM-dependent methyltransferase